MEGNTRGAQHMNDRIRRLGVIALAVALAVLTVACNSGSGSGY